MDGFSFGGGVPIYCATNGAICLSAAAVARHAFVIGEADFGFDVRMAAADLAEVVAAELEDFRALDPGDGEDVKKLVETVMSDSWSFPDSRP